MEISWKDFEKVEIRVGTIMKATIFKEARKPAYKLWIDFGEFGQRKSSAQLTSLYEAESLIGKQIIAVVNFPKKQIANFMSECLVLGLVGNGDEVVLLQPDRKVINGLRMA